ncbi:MAG: electron transport complex subunit RsxC [Pseudomonadales bacterium]|nr:electron transport complex subunit RsxC [Pseudomonadales bacterium]
MSTDSAFKLNDIKLRPHRIFGGIKPPAFKSSSMRSRIMPSPIPERLILSLRQHQGSAALPLVNVGDMVLKYQLIAAADQESALNLHAPTSGKIVAIESALIPSQLQQSEMCIHLQPDNKDNAIALNEISDYRAKTNADLVALVKQAGICGLGGAGYPTANKLKASIDIEAELLIINAAECEPYITADEALLREFAKEVVSGAEILQKICLASRCIIAIEKNKKEAVSALAAALNNSSISLVQLPAKYPAGGEKQIVQGVTGLEVPSGGYPPDIGVLVQNVGTAYAVHQAIVEGKPCISRITTLTGAPLQTPKNFSVLIGTPVSFLFEVCGIEEEQLTGAIVGGSIMGVELADLQAPVVKTTNCLIAKSTQEFPEAGKEQACIRCGFCADVCPAKLLPQQLYAYARSCNRDELESHGLFDCIECGACAYVCPSNIPLVQYYRASKQSFAKQLKQEEKSLYWQSRFQTHQYRLKKNQEDKLSQRKTKKNQAEV